MRYNLGSQTIEFKTIRLCTFPIGLSNFKKINLKLKTSDLFINKAFVDGYSNLLIKLLITREKKLLLLRRNRNGRKNYRVKYTDHP